MDVFFPLQQSVHVNLIRHQNDGVCNLACAGDARSWSTLPASLQEPVQVKQCAEDNFS